jgi:hypothetical protein
MECLPPQIWPRMGLARRGGRGSGAAAPPAAHTHTRLARFARPCSLGRTCSPTPLQAETLITVFVY